MTTGTDIVTGQRAPSPLSPKGRDVAGNVIGVVTAKADAAKIAELTGDIPQNVNFAITGTLVMDFLRAHRVQFNTANSATDVGAPRVAEMAQGFAPYIECWQ